MPLLFWLMNVDACDCMFQFLPMPLSKQVNSCELCEYLMSTREILSVHGVTNAVSHICASCYVYFLNSFVV